MKRNGTLLAIGIASLLALTGCVGDANGEEKPASHPSSLPPVNKDPTKGWVTVLNRTTYQSDFDKNDRGYGNIGLAKFCDGTTLLYLTLTYDGSAPGVTAIQNSPECLR